MFYWFMLFVSILAEIIGTSSLKYSGVNAGIFDYLFLFAMVGAAYFFLAKAIQGMSLSLAYAVWEGVGLITIVLIGCLLFDETLEREKVLACLAILGGIVLLNFGRRREVPKGGLANGLGISGFGRFVRRAGQYCFKIF
ncbi:SMR family transporter [Azotosporobacter soli]|uniref:SMR family transporter n=1 Tax=Azotosporobacter soli TaxID=3055040 RepID=UPI0031FF019B